MSICAIFSVRRNSLNCLSFISTFTTDATNQNKLWLLLGRSNLYCPATNIHLWRCEPTYSNKGITFEAIPYISDFALKRITISYKPKQFFLFFFLFNLFNIFICFFVFVFYSILPLRLFFFFVFILFSGLFVSFFIDPGRINILHFVLSFYGETHAFKQRNK